MPALLSSIAISRVFGSYKFQHRLCFLDDMSRGFVFRKGLASSNSSSTCGTLKLGFCGQFLHMSILALGAKISRNCKNK